MDAILHLLTQTGLHNHCICQWSSPACAESTARQTAASWQSVHRRLYSQSGQSLGTWQVPHCQCQCQCHSAAHILHSRVCTV